LGHGRSDLASADAQIMCALHDFIDEEVV